MEPCLKGSLPQKPSSLGQLRLNTQHCQARHSSANPQPNSVLLTESGGWQCLRNVPPRHPYHATGATGSIQNCLLPLQSPSLELLSPFWSQELDYMILICPFQLRITYDSMNFPSMLSFFSPGSYITLKLGDLAASISATSVSLQPPNKCFTHPPQFL